MIFKKKRGSGLVLATLVWCSTPSSFAGGMGTDADDPLDDLFTSWSNYIITVSGGPIWNTAGFTQTLYLQDGIVSQYNANKDLVTSGSLELFAGLERDINATFKTGLGLAVAGSGVTNVSGTIWQDADPTFNNFNYNYKINQLRVSVKGKLLAKDTPFVHIVQPYATVGLGVGFNRSYGYSETATLFQAIASPPFQSNTTTAFTYTVGLGVQKNINTHWQAGVGFELANWGPSSLAPAVGQTLNRGLSLNQLYTQELQFSISYVA